MNPRFSIKQKIILFLVSMLGPILIYIYSFTWRLRWSDGVDIRKTDNGTKNVVFALWHSRVLMLCHVFRFQNIGIMVSKSFDGEWIGRIIKHLGFRIFRGSTSRGGATALHEMIMNNDNSGYALMVDGPKGPAGRLKPGVISLASQTGRPVIPITCIAEKAWRVNSWDRLIIPKPFSKITVVCGEKKSIPSDIDKDGIAEYSQIIETELNKIG